MNISCITPIPPINPGPLPPFPGRNGGIVPPWLVDPPRIPERPIDMPDRDDRDLVVRSD